MIADLSCVIAGLPTACLDHTLDAADAAIAATDAATAVQREVRLCIVERLSASVWSSLLGLAAVLETHAEADRALMLDGLTLVADASSPASKATSISALAACKAAQRTSKHLDLAGGAPFTALYTSGSTGLPKPRWINARDWLVRNPKGDTLSNVSAVPIFSPLSHGLGRRQFWSQMAKGGRIGLLDPSDGLLEQLGTFEPSTITAVPSFYTLVTQRYELLLQAAREEAAAPVAEEHVASEKAALIATRSLFGRRLSMISVGGAFVPPDLLLFLERCFSIGGLGGGNCIVSNGYGATETGGIARNGELMSQWKEPLGACKLDEALGAALGQSAGVGEILLRTTAMEIAAPLDADGWYHTGDLGRWVPDRLDPERGPKRLQVVDRAGFAVKLSNGEFVCPQRLEALFEGQCPSVSECCLLAAAGSETITAVVVPTDVQAATEEGVLGEIRRAALGAKTHVYEVPSQARLDRNGPWSPANGCRTSSGKLRRAAIAKRAAVDDGEDAQLPPLEQRVVRFRMAPSEEVAAAALPEAMVEGVMLAQLGGNSIVASRAAERLPGLAVRRLISTALPELRRELQGSRPHGGPSGGSTASKSSGAEFWKAEADYTPPEEELEVVSSHVAEESRPSAVLLTGVTGFLGPHLLDAVASEPELAGMQLICLVRPPLERVRVPAAAEGSRVLLVAADLGAADLAIAADGLDVLRRYRIAVIVHNAAQVDHVQSYTQLKGPNVDAADALVRVVSRAGSLWPPAMVFISSLSALAPSNTDETLESTPASLVDLMGGYGQTKWVSERRLAAAARARLLSSLSIVRLGLIGPHSITGESNMHDWLHLTLRAIAALHSVPAGNLSSGEYSVNMLPADVTASVIARLAALRTRPTGERKPALVTAYHVDSKTFGFAPVSLKESLLPALEQLHGGAFEYGVKYETWRDRLRAAGGAAEAALAVLPPLTAAARGELRMPKSAARDELERSAGRGLADKLAGCQPGAARPRAGEWSDGVWMRWAAGLVKDVSNS